MQDEVTVPIDAPPGAVWALVSDVTRMKAVLEAGATP